MVVGKGPIGRSQHEGRLVGAANGIVHDGGPRPRFDGSALRLCRRGPGERERSEWRVWVRLGRRRSAALPSPADRCGDPHSGGLAGLFTSVWLGVQIHGLIGLWVLPFSPLASAKNSAAFAYLDRLSRSQGGVVGSADLLGFSFDGQPFRLMAPQQGIWKPRQLEAALSIRTVHAARPDLRPYDDSPGPDGWPRYKWRENDPNQADNRALRRAMELRRPLIWFRGVARSTYLPTYPVWLVHEEPALQQFVVVPDGDAADLWADAELALLPAQRRYAERLVQQRLHQPLFRERVLLAYSGRCALCRLRHRELLDAAHILADADGGEPVVPNGIAMCKIHHAAFDNWIFGIRPDYRIEVSSDVLAEHDGPTLRHALQEIHGAVLEVPRSVRARPDTTRLEERFERFLARAS